MLEIKEILLNFDKILLKEELKKTIICDILKKITGINIKTESIKIKDNILYLDIKPIYKNEILFKKELINTELKKAFGKKIPNKII